MQGVLNISHITPYLTLESFFLPLALVTNSSPRFLQVPKKVSSPVMSHAYTHPIPHQNMKTSFLWITLVFHDSDSYSFSRSS